MKSLWENVLEGTFDTSSYDDSSYEAEVESYVTEEPETMVAYVANCTEGMLAVQTAVAMMEGQCAVQYIRGQKEEATATMEGVLRNAWETLKDWIRRAYAAIKKFLKKAWNKMKGYVNVFKAMVTKYAYVLKGKKISGLKVDWVEIDMAGGRNALEAALKDIDNSFVKLKKGETAPASNYDGNKSYHGDLETGFFGGNTKTNKKGETTSYGRFVQEKDWNDVADKAVRIADDGFDKVYSEAFKLGEMTERDILKDLNEDVSERRDKADEKKTDSSRNKAMNAANQYARRKTNVVRDYCQMVNTAASLQVRLAVKACRKAIRHQAEASSATYGMESSTDFSAVMGEIL